MLIYSNVATLNKIFFKNICGEYIFLPIAISRLGTRYSKRVTPVIWGFTLPSAAVSQCECDYTYLKSYIFHFALSTVCDVVYVSVYTFILHSTRGGG